jgi:hypothetical protein
MHTGGMARGRFKRLILNSNPNARRGQIAGGQRPVDADALEELTLKPFLERAERAKLQQQS